MATRFYYQANSAPVVSPPLDAGWGSTASVVRRIMGTAQNAATETVAGSVADASSSLAVQLVSPPLAAQSITGTITIMTRSRELDFADNVNKRYRSVRVYAADGTTLRGTFNPFAATSSTTEFSTSFQGQIHAQNNGVGTLAVSDGDIIVVELGPGVNTTGDGSSQWEMVLGGTGTDHAVTNSDTTGTVAWLEFSQTLTFIASTVTLTPATATLTAMSNTASPGPVTMALTAATATATATTNTATPGVVTVALTPATATRTAVVVTPTPLTSGVLLTPATATLTAVAGTPTPGLVTTSILPGLLTLAAVTVQPQPLSVTVTLTPAVATLTAKSNTATPGVVTLAVTAATAALGAVAPTGVQPGVAVMALTPATIPVTAIDFVATPGVVTVSLTRATATFAAQQTTPAGIGAGSLTLTPAVTTVSGVQVTGQPGLVLTPLTVAVATLAGRTLTLTPGPTPVTLSAATAALSATAVSAAPGVAVLALTPAAATWLGVPPPLIAGQLTANTGSGFATWSAVPVIPEQVQGVLLRPAVATLRARKTNPHGSVLPLNTYELPLARVLLDCLTEVLVSRTENPPAHFSLRVGEQVPFDLSQNEDLCCEGLAYVKINRVYASTSFPVEDEGTWSPCGPLAWAADLEMGILRCAPTGDESWIPTDAEWTTSADQVANDSAAMRMAIASFRDRVDPGTEWVARNWLPIGPAGACTGGTQVITVGWIPC